MSRAIYRAAEKEQDVAGLTVEEVYARHRRRIPTTPEPSTRTVIEPDKKTQRLCRSIQSICKRTDEVIHDAAFATPAETVILIPVVRKAVANLQELLRLLDAQAKVEQERANRLAG